MRSGQRHFAAWKARFQPGDSNTLTEAASEEDDAVRKKEDGPDPDGQDASRQKKADPERAAKMESADPSILHPLCRPCRMDLLVTQVCDDASVVRRSNHSSESLNVPRVPESPRPQSAMPYSTPGAFIAQIAAINRAFARGRIVNVSANAVRGQTVMLIQKGEL